MSHSILSFCKLCTNLQYSFLMFWLQYYFHCNSIITQNPRYQIFCIITASILIVPAYHMTAYSGL